jgi:lipoprotein signal peptidase
VNGHDDKGRTAATPTSGGSEPKRNDKLRQRSIVLALLAAVIVLDQAIKWWAWRHASAATINDGGDALVGTTVGGWYADPVAGALFDLVDVGLLGIAVAVLVRRRRPAMVLTTGALMIGGWGSNLLDRLGMHYLTAPGSVRGAVDFIQLGKATYNVADFFIIGATPLFLLAVGASYLGRWAAKTPATTGSVTPTTHHQPRKRTRMSVLAGAVGLVVVVGIGAANFGGVTTPTTSTSVSAQSPVDRHRPWTGTPTRPAPTRASF